MTAHYIYILKYLFYIGDLVDQVRSFGFFSLGAPVLGM